MNQQQQFVASMLNTTFFLVSFFPKSLRCCDETLDKFSIYFFSKIAIHRNSIDLIFIVILCTLSSCGTQHIGANEKKKINEKRLHENWIITLELLSRHRNICQLNFCAQWNEVFASEMPKTRKIHMKKRTNTRYYTQSVVNVLCSFDALPTNTASKYKMFVFCWYFETAATPLTSLSPLPSPPPPPPPPLTPTTTTHMKQ